VLISSSTDKNIVCDTKVDGSKLLTWFFWVWTAESDHFHSFSLDIILLGLQRNLET